MPNPFSNKKELQAALKAIDGSKIIPAPPLWIFQLLLGQMNPLGFDVSKPINAHDQAFQYGKAVAVEHVMLVLVRENLHPSAFVEVLKELAHSFDEASRSSDVSPGFQIIFSEFAAAISSPALCEETIGTRSQAIKGTLAAACDWPLEIAAPFFNGFVVALAEGIPGGDNFPKKTPPRANIYQILLTNWQHVETLRTMKEVYEWACGELGESCVGDLPTFTRLCHRIDLKRGRTGRPKKKSDMKDA